MASVESVPAFLHQGIPVSQPPHLEGDPSLATEILPGPPSLASIQQAGLPRKDHKKATVAYSYLPSSDPGTTYTTHFVSSISAAPADMDGTRRKRARLDKGAESSRSQRASARSLAVVAPSADPIVLPEATASSSHALSDFDPQLLPPDSDDAMVSRATSFHAEESPPESADFAKRNPARFSKDKGKGKEKERDGVGVVKVKEELVAGSMGNELPNAFPNEDHCSACRSLGALVYCDGCTKAFHWLCLDPPMEATDLPEGESRWFCPACELDKRPPPKPLTTLKFMAPLIQELSTRIPAEFQLPQDIRSYFKDVGTGPRGTYQDTSEAKQARFNRHGQLEDRDPYRLKDRNGEAVLCFRCGTSALPPGMAADAPAVKRARRASSRANNYDSGKVIISCDYCHLHWHLDCLDPPLIVMPPWSKKWMCPNHAENVLQPRRRVPRANATPIDIIKPHQANNGNIEIIQADTAPPPALVPDKWNADEVLINGRRYRVPERIITLDFWDKIAKNRRGESASETREADSSSAMSSPLTSLSSLDDPDNVPPFSMEPALYTLDDVRFAQLLCGLRLQSTSGSSVGEEEHPKSVPNSSHRGPNLANRHIKVEAQDEMPSALSNRRTNTNPASDSASTNTIAESSRPRRVAAPRTSVARHGSSRMSGRSGDDTPMDVDFELPELVISSGKRPNARRKAARPPEPVVDAPSASASKEADDTPVLLDISAIPIASLSSRPKRTRPPARRPCSPSSRAEVSIKLDPDASPKRELPPPPPKATHGVASNSGSARMRANGADSSTRARKPVTPVANGQAAAPIEAKTEATPTLKIRLPRLGGVFNSPSAAGSQSLATDTSKASPTKRTTSRARRSLRKQTSIPTSLHSASISDAGSSSRVNDSGLSSAASPIESF